MYPVHLESVFGAAAVRASAARHIVTHSNPNADRRRPGLPLPITRSFIFVLHVQIKYTAVVTEIMVDVNRYRSTVITPGQRRNVRMIANGGRNGSFSEDNSCTRIVHAKDICPMDLRRADSRQAAAIGTRPLSDD